MGTLIRVGRNDPCPCRSGKKFKVCCLRKSNRPLQISTTPAVNSQEFRLSPAPGACFPVASFQRPAVNACHLAACETARADLPKPSSIEVLPVEIGLHYAFPEELGVAEVTHILPAGRIYELADGKRIVNDDLQVGMRLRLRDGNIGTVTQTSHYLEPPRPPVEVRKGMTLARVVGTIKHKGLETNEVAWLNNVVTASSNHRFYSVSRGDYVEAENLKVGEFLQGDNGDHVPISSIGEKKLGLIDLYNIEVEHFHNFYVGGDPSVLVHNGAAGGGLYINVPRDLGSATRIAHPDLPIRLPGGPTHGIFNDSLQLMSGPEGGNARAVFASVLSRLSDDARTALRHVEGHAAAEMVSRRLIEAVLHINYKTGPCGFCRSGVPELLGSSQKLWVVFPDGVGYFTNAGWVRSI